MSDDLYKKIFAKNLNRYMALHNKEQIDLVNDLGFNKSAVSTWCNATRLPRMDKVDMLAKYFNINRSDLIEDKDENTLHISKNNYIITPTEYLQFIKMNDPELPQRIEDKLKGDEYVGNVNVTRLQKYVNKLLSVTETQRMLIYNIIDEMYPSSNEEAATQNVYDSSSSKAPTLPKHLEDCRVDDDVNYSSTTSANS